ncbi:hypothetical protein AAVH_06836 [Aphelenchoides avenae]|nr:hypothetical protein AAVH_06836 [Aphelenchus avenae]
MNATVVIPGSVYIGYIIGRGGRTIRSIEEKTKTKIRWPYKSNPADRKFTINGFGSHASADVDKAVDEMLQLVNGRLTSMELPSLQKNQLLLSLAPDNSPKQQAAPAAQQKRYVSDHDFVEILRWLRRFDLDRVHITSRKLRRLTEDNQMPRRHLFEVHYNFRSPRGSHLMMIIPNRADGHRLGSFYDVDSAVGYVSYAFVEKLVLSCYAREDYYLPILPSRELLAAPDEHIKKIHVSGGCGNVDFLQGGVLQEAICVCRFEQFSVNSHDMPDSLISDDFLRRLGRAGCTKVDLSKLMFVSPISGNFAATDDGILDYCFSSDLGALGSRERSLWIAAGVSISPTFVKKCIQAHFASRVTSKMELELHKSDPPYDVSGFLEDLAEYAAYCLDVSENETRYDFTDHGDNMRLLIRLRIVEPLAFPNSRLLVRRGHKDDEEFFLQGYAF